MCDTAPVHRIYCSWPAVDREGTCNTYLGRRARVAGNYLEEHEWKSCPSCQCRQCMVFEVKPSDDDQLGANCSLPRAVVDWNSQHDMEERLVRPGHAEYPLTLR